MTYEADPVLRLLARTQLKLLSATVAELVLPMPLAERVELIAAVAEVQRLLFGDEAPPAPELPANVRRLVAAGRRGPAFMPKEEAVIGRGGLRSGRYEESVPMDLIDIDAKYDSRECGRRTDEEFLAATDQWRRP